MAFTPGGNPKQLAKGIVRHILIGALGRHAFYLEGGYLNSLNSRDIRGIYGLHANYVIAAIHMMGFPRNGAAQIA